MTMNPNTAKKSLASSIMIPFVCKDLPTPTSELAR
jgi:hypothetical protein